MKRLFAFGVSFVLLVSMALLNPGAKTHRLEIAKTYTSQNPVSGNLGIGEILASAGKYHDYVFLSTMSIHKNRVSVGVFGFVYASPPTLSEAVENIVPNLPESTRKKIIETLPKWMQEEE